MYAGNKLFSILAIAVITRSYQTLISGSSTDSLAIGHSVLVNMNHQVDSATSECSFSGCPEKPIEQWHSGRNFLLLHAHKECTNVWNKRVVAVQQWLCQLWSHSHNQAWLVYQYILYICWFVIVLETSPCCWKYMGWQLMVGGDSKGGLSGI